MNDIIFYNNFRFNEFSFNETRRSDNSHGIEYHFIGYIKKGRGKIVSSNGVLEVNENQMFYIPKGLKYCSTWIAKPEVVFDSIGFLYFPSKTDGGYKLQTIDYDEEVFKAFLPLSKNKSVNNGSIGALYSLLSILEPKLERDDSTTEESVCEKLILLIKENPQRTIPEYANILNVSESLLFKYTKKRLLKTPNRLRQEILCEKAKEMLITTNYTIEQICDKLQFSSSAYFRKVFFSVYRKTPSSVRKNTKLM